MHRGGVHCGDLYLRLGGDLEKLLGVIVFKRDALETFMFEVLVGEFDVDVE